jgi:hypothetical protein
MANLEKRIERLEAIEGANRMEYVMVVRIIGDQPPTEEQAERIKRGALVITRVIVDPPARPLEMHGEPAPQ